MGQIAVQPIVIKDMRLRIDVDNYEMHVSSVIFTPAFSQVSWQGGTPEASFTDSSNATWTCALEFAQDWETEDALSRYLFEHAGETKEVEFAPQSGTGKTTFTANLSIQPGQIGMAVGVYATSTVTLGSNKPTIGTSAIVEA